MNNKKVILITGISSGLGEATGKLLSEKGYTVYGTSRRYVEINNINWLYMDVTKSETIQEAVNSIIQREKHIDVLINNAGIGIGGAIELATDDEISKQMETNFFGCVKVCKAVLPHMRQQEHGLIINFSSIGGIIGLPYQGYYSASKFAIEGYSEALATEVNRFGIKVTLIEPGDFATNFTTSRINSTITMENSDYKDSFNRSLYIITNEENSGLKPIVAAKKILKIINKRHVRFRNVVANNEQKLSIFIKRVVPAYTFIKIIGEYYKV